MQAEYDIYAAQMYGLPVGTNISKSLPPSSDDDYIKNKCDLCVFNINDLNIIGDGMFIIGKYVANFLMKNSSSSSSCNSCYSYLPIKAKLYAVGVQLGEKYIGEEQEEEEETEEKKKERKEEKQEKDDKEEKEKEEKIDISSWQTYRYSEGFFSLNLDYTKHKILTLPLHVDTFAFTKKDFDSFEGRIKKEEIIIKEEGHLNGFVFFYELFLDENTIVCNAPLAVYTFKNKHSEEQKEEKKEKEEETNKKQEKEEKKEKNEKMNEEQTKEEKEEEKKEKGMNYKNERKEIKEEKKKDEKEYIKMHPFAYQSCQILEEIFVQKNSKIFVEISVENSKIALKFDKQKILNFNQIKTDVHLYDPVWKIVNEKTAKLNCEISRNIYTQPLAYKQTMESMLRVAIDPGNFRSFQIEPQVANTTFKTLFF